VILHICSVIMSHISVMLTQLWRVVCKVISILVRFFLWIYKPSSTICCICSTALSQGILVESLRIFVYNLADGKTAYVSWGFSIKGHLDLAQRSVHSWSRTTIIIPPLILKSSSAVPINRLLNQSIVSEHH